MKTTIKNRDNINLSIIIEGEQQNKGLAFVVHGLGGFKEQIHIRAIMEAFLENGYTVVSYDAANSIGESGGQMEKATLSNYFEDLEDVVKWAEKQGWYTEPFIVTGHSLGGASSLMFAAKYPEKVKAIAPISAFTGIDLQEGHWKNDPEFAHWKAQGYKFEESVSKPGVMKKIGWVFMEDALTHDMRKAAPKIRCRSLFITGSDDKLCSPRYQQMVMDKLSGPADLHVIEGMEHNPRTKVQNNEIKQTISEWLKKL